MSLNSQIETAKDAVSKALVTALENKNELVISKLMNCYTSLNTITVTDMFESSSKYKIDFGEGIYYTNNYNIPGSVSNDGISFTGLG